MATVAAASGLATLAAFGIVLATGDLGDFPRGVFVAYGALAVLVAIVSRLLVRLVPEAGRGEDEGRLRVIIVVAVRAGRVIALDLRDAGDARVVGFLDDNPRLGRRRVQGVPVLGTTEDVASVLAATRADELVITIPDASAERLESVARACDVARIPCRIVRDKAPDSRATTQALAE
jgi:FlaA1/EpsC-like NDP-sugar epimerase